MPPSLCAAGSKIAKTVPVRKITKRSRWEQVHAYEVHVEDYQ